MRDGFGPVGEKEIFGQRLKKMKSLWSDEEMAILKTYYVRGEKERLIAELQNRTWIGIKRKARRLGLRFCKEKPKISREGLEKNYKLKGYRQTAKYFGVSNSTIYNWLRKAGIPPLRKINEPKLSPSISLLHVLGVMKGDGFTTIRKSHYTAGLATLSIEFATSFAEALRNIGLHPQFYSYTFSYKSKKLRAYRVIAYSKKFVAWYRNLNVEDIRKMIGKDKKLAAAFVRGFFESEGSFYLIKGRYPAISIGNSNLQLLTIVRDLISFLGISMNLWAGKAGKGKHFYCLHKAGKNVLDLINTLKPSIKASPSNLKFGRSRDLKCQP